MLSILKDSKVKAAETTVRYQIEVTIEHPGDLVPIDVARVFESEAKHTIVWDKIFENGNAKVVNVNAYEVESISSKG